MEVGLNLTGGWKSDKVWQIGRAEIMNDSAASERAMSQTITFHPIGRVERDAGDEGLSHNGLRARPARILLDPALSDGLMGLEPGSDIVVLYYLHRSSGYDLRVHPRGDPSRPLRGVFAVRSPRRPNPIGVTTARVLRVAGNLLEVVGLDALDGSPVLDIKARSSSFDSPYVG